jgi:hypothetical protein
MWFERQGIQCNSPLRELSFESPNFTLQAEQSGQGITLGRSLQVVATYTIELNLWQYPIKLMAVKCRTKQHQVILSVDKSIALTRSLKPAKTL